MLIISSGIKTTFGGNTHESTCCDHYQPCPGVLLYWCVERKASGKAQSLAYRFLLSGIGLRHLGHRHDVRVCGRHGFRCSWNIRFAGDHPDVHPCRLGDGCPDEEGRKDDRQLPQVQHFRVAGVVDPLLQPDGVSDCSGGEMTSQGNRPGD